MAEIGQAWSRVGDRFAELGRKLAEHYRQAGGDEDRASQEQVATALRTLGEAVERAASSIDQAVRDPAVHEEAKAAAVSLVDALEATFSGVGEELRRAFGREGGED